jgi:hypothetical protein
MGLRETDGTGHLELVAVERLPERLPCAPDRGASSTMISCTKSRNARIFAGGR